MSALDVVSLRDLMVEYSGYPTDFLEAEIQGVSAAIQNLTEAGATDPVVKATVMLSESGFASVRDAVVTGEFKDESLTGRSISVLNLSGYVTRHRRQTEGLLWERFLVGICG